MMNRRAFVGGALSAGMLSACAPLAPRASFTLPPVHVSADRVIRVVAGLRPYRPSGYVVREERLGSKRLIHNYGHGGAGVTLSWGTAEQALALGFEGPGKRYAVIGCGAVGLATALLLQRRGGTVTIYAKALPPDTTSNIAGAHWSPFSVFERAAASPAFLEQFNQALRLAHRHFQALVGARFGVEWRRDYIVTDHFSAFGPERESMRDLFPEMRLLAPGAHPFGDAYVQQQDSMMIEPGIYLRALMDLFLTNGGRIEVREFAAPGELTTLAEAVIFNCTGLGTRALFGDEEMIPARGQLVVLLPQPEVRYNVLSSGGFYMFPRGDGIVLGGTFERNNWSLEPDAAATTKILEGNARVMALLNA